MQNGQHVRRKSDGKTGFITNVWVQCPSDPDQTHERVFVLADDGIQFLSSGTLGESATRYEIIP